jgi:L,D-transpeptidase YcbB
MQCRQSLATGLMVWAVAAGSVCAEPLRVATAEITTAASETLGESGSPAAAEGALVLDLRDALALPVSKLSEEEREQRAALAAFYADRKGSPLWVAQTGFTARGAVVLAEIRRAEEWGLKAADFDLPSLDASDPDREALSEAEAKLSLAVLEYARQARGGRISEPAQQLSSYLDRAPGLLEPKTVLESIATAPELDAYLRGLHPAHPEFERLRQAYLKARGAVGGKPLVTIPAGPNIKPGQRHPDVALLRARLDVAAADAADETHYDEKLAAAVKAFQADKGLAKAGGTITSGTRAALNAADTNTVRKLLANMEQWRWMPADLGDLYVWVNIPEFTLRVVKNGEVIHSERIIAGKTDTQTPVFSDEMQTIVLHPFWGVPESIKVKELWPSLARGGGALQRHGLRLQRNGRDIDPASVDWTRADIRNFHVYQPPGGGNVLGVVKFVFPNKHQVYMHDTPTKNLFGATQRTFSHGCMRVRNPVQLAEVLLAEDKAWAPARVAELVRSGPQNNEIALSRKIPVHVTYFTARVDEAGKAQLFPDVYGHEQRVTLALDGRWSQIVKGRDHLAPVKAEPITRLAESESGFGASPISDLLKAVFGGF